MQTLTKIQYRAIGKLLVIRNPNLAHELLAACDRKDIMPKETDLSRIHNFYASFCLLKDINPEEYRGAILNRTKTATRKMFVACMLHIYAPSVFNPVTQPLDKVRGIVRTLSRELHVKEANICNMIKEVARWNQLYDDFRANVEELTEKILKVNEQTVE